MSNKELIRKAFDDVCVAISNLEVAKNELANLNAKAERVEIMSKNLENASRVFEPSSDIHEEVFIKHEQAKHDFEQSVNSITRDSIRSQLIVASNATNEANSIIKTI